MKKLTSKVVLAAALLTVTTWASAQRMPHKEYRIIGNKAMYANKVIREADVRTFEVLGHGYAKDRENGYPNTSAMNKRYYKYVVSTFEVYFEGRKVKGASASTFQVLKDGYSKDTFSAYYYGEKVKGVSAHSFQVDEGGYAHDTFSTYYQGKKIN